MKRTINQQINSHACKEKKWKLQPIAVELTKFAEIFQQELFNEETIPAPLISIDASNARTLGTYRIGYNGMGIRDHININVLWLSARPLYSTLATLLHEMGHSWEYARLPEDERTNNWYHKKRFIDLMAGFGITCNERGQTLSIDPDGKFGRIMVKNNIEPTTAIKVETEGKVKKAGRVDPSTTPKGKSTLKKWSCKCTNIRCAVNLKATCNRCDEPFIKQE